MPADAPVILTVAGTDPGGGAGLLLDRAVASAFQLGCSAVVSAVTAQDHLALTAIEPVADTLFTAQLNAALQQQPAACKVGLLAAAGQPGILAQQLPDKLPVVLDPVIASSSGSRMMPETATQQLRAELIPRCLLVTPNLDELAVLCNAPVDSSTAIQHAAESLLQTGCQAVLTKGGHAHGTELCDTLWWYADQQLRQRHFTHPRLPGNFRGTGCLLSTAITALLARNPAKPLDDICRLAIDYLQQQLANTTVNADHAVCISPSSWNCTNV